jgi:anti-sigma factor RsiW
MNAEIRDQLPDLVHDRLSAAARAAVLAHVDGCVDCRDELEVLRDAKALFARGIPRVDVAYVVGALPKAPAPRAVTRLEPARRKRVWSDWRIAAAAALVIAAGGSYAAMNGRTMPDVVDTTIAMSQPGATPTIALNGDSDIAAVVSSDDDVPAPIGSMDTRLGDLSEDQLNVLLNDMDNLRAVPASEPEPVSLRGDGNSTLEDM